MYEFNFIELSDEDLQRVLEAKDSADDMWEELEDIHDELMGDSIINGFTFSIGEEFKTLIANELPSKKKGRKTPPKHLYAPTEIQGVKRDSLRMMFDLQKNIFSQSELKGVALRERVLKFFSSERYRKKRNLVPMSFVVDTSNRNDDHSAEADRNIRRYRQKAHQLLFNVANGEFPGKY